MLNCHKWDFGQCPVNAQPGVAGQHCQPGTVPCCEPRGAAAGSGLRLCPSSSHACVCAPCASTAASSSCQGRPDEIWDIGNNCFLPLVLFLWVFYPRVGMGPLEEAEVLVILNKIQPPSARQIFPELWVP